MFSYVVKLFGCVREKESVYTVASNGSQCIGKHGAGTPKEGKVFNLLCQTCLFLCNVEFKMVVSTVQDADTNCVVRTGTSPDGTVAVGFVPASPAQRKSSAGAHGLPAPLRFTTLHAPSSSSTV
jgi:hypothetical protein